MLVSAASNTSSPYDFSAAEIKQQLEANGLTQVLFDLPAGDWAKGERGITCHPDPRRRFRAGVDKAIEYAKVLGNTQVNCPGRHSPTRPGLRHRAARPSSTT